jgi:hypothetical protein
MGKNLRLGLLPASERYETRGRISRTGAIPIFLEFSPETMLFWRGKFKAHPLAPTAAPLSFPNSRILTTFLARPGGP